jgi:SagB-type dehydrogenase family enzyme
MSFFLHAFFHNKTVDRTENGAVNVPTDVSLWPESWKNVFYKKYTLFKPIQLPQGDDSFLYKELLSKRSSGVGVKQDITLESLAYILRCGYGLQDRGNKGSHRTVPSAGGRYPLEIYAILFKDIPHCNSGIYHYDVRNHKLELVANASFSKSEISSYFGDKWLTEANGVICMTGVFERTVDKYGSRGYRYVLLEAGHVAQNMILAATESKLKITPVGGVNEDLLENKMRLNAAFERLVYVLAI